MVYLEHPDANCFVELSAGSDKLRVRSGRLGTAGAVRVLPLDKGTVAEAYRRKLHALCKRGYVPGRQNPAMLEDIARAPNEPGPREVYGDWLLIEGDPRGELIAVHARLAERPDDQALRKMERALLDQHGDSLLGPWRQAGELSWHLGFVDAARFSLSTFYPSTFGHTIGLVRRLLQHPTGAFVRSLVFVATGPWFREDFWQQFQTELTATLQHWLGSSGGAFPQLLDTVTFEAGNQTRTHSVARSPLTTASDESP